MEKINMKVIEPIGIHAKVAAGLVNIASQYKSDIFLTYDEKDANMKSILNILALGINNGEYFSITIKGVDELEASIKMENYLIEKKIAIKVNVF